ncbi:hypothetical protein FNH22_14875 [Fulvivirga sp. M361]|uniref:hypothetical protein n=1 Tax=Fulvivirga sp. M361 TaxID=2594266 RepID=UPI00117BCBE8|nr:hypothetical protein [Fulvivirga sp. M361]TRX57693.1 hypothetical protein FNH22_14875 [Fulvivirga sp. M361]
MRSSVIFLVVFWLLFGSLYGQSLVKEIPIGQATNGSGFFLGASLKGVEIIPFYYNGFDNGLLAIKDKKRIVVKEMTPDFSISNSVEAQVPELSRLLGGTRHHNMVSLFYLAQSTQFDQTIIIQEIVFGNKVHKQYKVRLGKDEKFFTSISDNNKCYILTRIRNSSDVCIYPLKPGDYPRKMKFTLGPVVRSGRKVPFYRAFNESPVFISENAPSSFLATSKDHKIYMKDDVVWLTMDNYEHYTLLIKLDIKNEFARMERVEHIVSKREYNRTNSLIFQNVIYSLSTCDAQLYLTLRDINTKREIQSFSVSKYQQINFKNSPIFQEGGGGVREMQINETKTFLRKMSRLSVALAIEEIDDKYKLSIGGFKEITTGYGGFVPGGAGAFVSSPVFTAYSLNSWGNKYVYFNTILEAETLDYLENEPVKTGHFEKIKAFESEVTPKPMISTVFKFKGHYYYCYYHKKDDMLRFVKF